MINLNDSIIVFSMESFQIQTTITYNDINIINQIDDNRFAFIDNCQVGIFDSNSSKIELIDYDLRLNAPLTDDAFYDRGTNVHWTFLLTKDILLLGLIEGRKFRKFYHSNSTFFIRAIDLKEKDNLIRKYINNQGKEVQIEFGMSCNLLFNNKKVKGMERLNENHIIAIDENEIKIYKY